jgi:hypothetical protein
MDVDDVKLWVAVITVPSRESRARALAHYVDAQTVLCDPEMRGCWFNARRAWLSAPKEFTHCLVLSDDAEPIPEFRKYATAAISVNAAVPISFFCSNEDKIEVALRLNASWISYPCKGWGVALCMPVDMAQRFVAWCDEHTKDTWRADDTRMGLWCAMMGWRLYASVPSLVQHADIPSTADDRKGAKCLRAPLVEVPTRPWNDRALAVEDDVRSYVVGRSMHLKRGNPWSK